MNGFIPLNRCLFEESDWREHRQFSRFEAWLDLIRMAAFKPFSYEIKPGIFVDVPRGCVVTSERFLADRWAWSRKKVRSFLGARQTAHHITRQKAREKARDFSILSICKYDTYTAENSEKGPAKGPPKTEQGGPPKGPKMKDVSLSTEEIDKENQLPLAAVDESLDVKPKPKRRAKRRLKTRPDLRMSEWLECLKSDSKYNVIDVEAKYIEMIDYCEKKQKE